jgi:hypothetical protein|tara:strand:- start:4750 stop:4944 length:195 start_codon:yes stop_codon:yes gene_type:complete
MAHSPKIRVIGPFPPADFAELAATRTALDAAMTAAAASTPGTALVGAEPVTILGNLYLILSSTA